MIKLTLPVLLCLLLAVACSDPMPTPAPSPTPMPSATPEPTATTAPTSTPVPTATPEPAATNTPIPTPEPPTATETATPPPTVTPMPAATAAHTPAPTIMPTETPVPTAIQTPAPLTPLTATAQELWTIRWNDDDEFQATQLGREVTITGRVAEVANGEVRLYADESEIFEPIPGAGVLFSSYIALRGLPVEVQQAASRDDTLTATCTIGETVPWAIHLVDCA